MLLKLGVGLQSKDFLDVGQNVWESNVCYIPQLLWVSCEYFSFNKSGVTRTITSVSVREVIHQKNQFRKLSTMAQAQNE